MRNPGPLTPARPPARSRPRRWFIDPAVRGLTGLPLALAAIPMAVAGYADAAARIQIRTAARFPGPTAARFPGPTAVGGRPGDVVRSRPGGAPRVLVHSLLALVPALVGFGAAAMQLFTAWSGYLYPLRPDTIAAIGHPLTPDPQVLPGAWGGPTLIGAWAVHACVALATQLLCGALLAGLCALQNRTLRRLTR